MEKSKKKSKFGFSETKNKVVRAKLAMTRLNKSKMAASKKETN